MSQLTRLPLRTRLNAIPWSDFRTCLGPADKMGGKLERLASTDPAAALAASRELWCDLVSGGIGPPPVAVLALPFVLDVLPQASEELTIELLELVWRCIHFEGPDETETFKELRRMVMARRPRLLEYAAGPSQEIAEWAKDILADIG
ncbi:hypothetical protein [Variovorax sp. CCNWLW235]|uniref:hypothetical protein n=1 Tax=Variovorax sp. CCNWLW235 TaxID=3127463 RepID=UPI0030780C6B